VLGESAEGNECIAQRCDDNMPQRCGVHWEKKCLGIHKNIGCGSGCGIFDAFVFFLKLGNKKDT